VQSLAWQSHRSGASPEAAQARFQSRLLALSRTHNLLNESHWEGALLRTILETELAPYMAAPSRVVTRGADVYLPPKPAVVLGMAFHELATNAVKYGALSTGSGQLKVAWTIGDENGAPVLTIDWCETEGREVETAPKPGFGSRLLRQTVAGELAGELDLRFEREGVCCIIKVPIGTASQQAA